MILWIAVTVFELKFPGIKHQRSWHFRQSDQLQFLSLSLRRSHVKLNYVRYVSLVYTKIFPRA